MKQNKEETIEESNGLSNGLFTIPQEELSEISWQELRKVLQ